MVFSGFNPILEPSLLPNLIRLNHDIKISSTKSSYSLALVPKLTQESEIIGSSSINRHVLSLDTFLFQLHHDSHSIHKTKIIMKHR